MAILLVACQTCSRGISRLIVTNHIKEISLTRPDVIVLHYTDGRAVDVYLPENTDTDALFRELAELWFSNRVIHFNTWVKKFKKAESTENGKSNCSGECQNCKLSFGR